MFSMTGPNRQSSHVAVIPLRLYKSLKKKAVQSAANPTPVIPNLDGLDALHGDKFEAVQF